MQLVEVNNESRDDVEKILIKPYDNKLVIYFKNGDIGVYEFKFLASRVKAGNFNIYHNEEEVKAYE